MPVRYHGIEDYIESLDREDVKVTVVVDLTDEGTYRASLMSEGQTLLDRQGNMYMCCIRDDISDAMASLDVRASLC